MAAPLSRKQLSIPGLLSEARRCLAKIPDDAAGDMPLVDHLMSGLAMFGLKEIFEELYTIVCHSSARL